MSALIQDSSQLKQLQDQQALTCDGTAIPRDKENDDVEESKINSAMRQDTSSSDVAMESAQSSVSKAAIQISTGEDAEMFMSTQASH